MMVIFIKSLPGKGLKFRSSPQEVEAYNKLNYAGSAEVRKLIIGFCIFPGKNLIPSCNKK